MATLRPYLIRLTPSGSFFFGGERNLSGTGNESYFVHSRHFPQQTSLLGMLRFQILAAYGLLDKPHKGGKIKTNAPQSKLASAQLIGETSFQPGHNKGFGKIAAISPVLLCRDSNFFAPMLSAQIPYNEVQQGKFGSIFEEEVHDYLPNLNGYDPKHTPDAMLYGTGGQSPVRMDDVFKEKTSVGIAKNKRHFPWLFNREKKKDTEPAEMEGFFKQVSYFFKDNWSFAFLAWIEEDAAGKLSEHATSNPWATIGAERSVFRFEMELCEPLPDMTPAFPLPESDFVRVVLLSDAWVDPDEIYKTCRFAHAETQDLRFLQSNVRTTANYYRREINQSNDTFLTRSMQYHLFRKGSVFFCKNNEVEPLKDILKNSLFDKNPSAFRRIGYNAFAEVHSKIQVNYFNPDNQ